MRGGAGRGQGRKPGSLKKESEKRKRIPMTTIHPANHKYLVGLKDVGLSLAKVFDEMIEDHKAKGNSR